MLLITVNFDKHYISLESDKQFTKFHTTFPRVQLQLISEILHMLNPTDVKLVTVEDGIEEVVAKW